jgi:hypothetical protein
MGRPLVYYNDAQRTAMAACWSGTGDATTFNSAWQITCLRGAA